MTRQRFPLILILISCVGLWTACAGNNKDVTPNDPPKVANTEQDKDGKSVGDDSKKRDEEPELIAEVVPQTTEDSATKSKHEGVEGGVIGGALGGVVGGSVGGVITDAATSSVQYRLSSTPMAQISQPLMIAEEKPNRVTGYDYENRPGMNTEEFGLVSENRFLSAAMTPLSTFSVDVDRASFSLVRSYLDMNRMPPRDAVRIEELINYFSYEYPDPMGRQPFSVTTEIAECPWAPDNKILKIGLQGRRINIDKLPPSNLVFLLDVSGSMNTRDKLPLLKTAMGMLIDNLRPDDRVAIVVYAGAAGLVLDSTPGSNKAAIWNAIDHLQAGGSTAGGAGIQLAYQVAKDNFMHRGNNRVILATDGDFNVGTTNNGDLETLIENKRESGIFLSVLGFGHGNIKDSKMELLADKGNGNYSYIDGPMEAKKTLVNEMGGTLFTIAKDVKLQIEFNPARVASYRLIGYENRVLASEDFNDDKKDAGEIGAGHSVTALYEIVPAGSSRAASVDPLKYQRHAPSESSELATVKVRYKDPDGDRSKLSEFPVSDNSKPFNLATDDLRFAASVAELGLLLRNSEHKGQANFDHVVRTAGSSLGHDPEGYRNDFIRLARKAATMADQGEVAVD